MRSARTLRYAELDIVTQAHTRTRDERVCAETMSETPRSDRRQLGEGTHCGKKSLERIARRMDARAERTAMRDALDLIRQEELMNNMERREARARSRRWYVLGRAVEALMGKDDKLNAQIAALLDLHLIRANERRLFDLPSLATNAE